MPFPRQGSSLKWLCDLFPVGPVGGRLRPRASKLLDQINTQTVSTLNVLLHVVDGRFGLDLHGGTFSQTVRLIGL
eukprot:1160887-Pelagomonas_calceolata.AAC.11